MTLTTKLSHKTMKTLPRILLTAVTAVLALSAQSQDKPRWAIKGVDDLNKERTNETYRFVKFETFGGDLALLRNESSTPLVEYLASTFGLPDDRASVSELSAPETIERSLPNDSEVTQGISRDFAITFAGDNTSTFYARLVDEYVSFDDNVDETYDYTLYQLYEVSNREDGIMPEYDDCYFTRSYNTGALIHSIIPGMGQLYKGQNTKAYCIWGGEAVCIAAALWCEKRRADYADDRNNAMAEGKMDAWDSYRSKSQSWRVLRNIAIGGAIGVYVYNLIDAAVSKGPRQVVVRKGSSSSGVGMAIAPTLVYDPDTTVSPAIGLSMTF